MAKYRITVEIDTSSGDYEMSFRNLTKKEDGVDYHLAMEAMYKIFGDFEKKTRGEISLGETELRGDN